MKISLKEKIKGSRKNAQTLEILFKVRKHGTVYVKKKKKKIKHNLSQYLPSNFRVNYFKKSSAKNLFAICYLLFAGGDGKMMCMKIKYS